MASWLLAGASACLPADEVGVFIANPGMASYVAAAERLRRQLPAAEARWNKVAATGATFKIAIHSVSDRHGVAQPCDGVPIAVRIERGEVTSATYAVATESCTAGTPVRAADVSALLAPAALFQQLTAQLDRAVQGQACVEGEFDADFGLPTELREGCLSVKGADLQIRITDIVSTRQQLWNLAVTVGGGVLILLALAFYHLRKVRRREQMPELLLR